MKYFSVPADFKKETIDRYEALNRRYKDAKVLETYGQLTSVGLVNSGRVTEVLPNVDVKSFTEYVSYSKDKGIDFNYTLNPSCLGNMEFSEAGMEQLIAQLKLIKSLGVDSLTLTSPQLMELVKGVGLGFKIKASAICEITSPSKALFYKKMGVERVVVDPDITRNFEKLKNICKGFGSGVEIIINNVCYKDCAYKMFHYNHEAHCTKDHPEQTIRNYYFNRCSMQKASGYKNSVRLNWIRPEDLKYYTESGISYFKLQGRQNIVNGDGAKTLEHYFNGDFDGNLFDLITMFAPYNSFQPYMDNKKLDGFVKTFYDHPTFCKDLCDSCKYCEKYAMKCIDRSSVEELNKQALDFYTAYDDYTHGIRRHVRSTSRNEGFTNTELDCEFEF